MNRTTQPCDPARYLARCPAKGCNCILRVDIPMMRDRWTETHHDHAHGTSWNVQKAVEYPSLPYGKYFHIYNLEVHCTVHRYRLQWKQINGTYSAEHICDARCMGARGPNCECSCGGANHGGSYKINLQFA